MRAAPLFRAFSAAVRQPSPRVVDTLSGAEEAVADLRALLALQSQRHGALLGVDCEWSPVRKGQKLRGVELVQLAATDRLQDAVLFRCGLGVPQPLKALLEDPVGKAVVGVMDAKVLWRSGVMLRGAVDLQRAARFLGEADAGASLAQLYEKICGAGLSQGKAEQRSDWRATELSPSQAAYAAEDAIAARAVLGSLCEQYGGDLSTSEFAGLFADAFDVDASGDLQRWSLEQAASAILASPHSSQTVSGIAKAMLPQWSEEKRSKRKKGTGNSKKFYAVARGSRVGVYNSWDECKVQVKDFKGARFKSFPDRVAAEAFVSQFSS